VSVDLVTVGRVSVDLYGREVGASFAQPQTFSKSVGGSPTNVAVAAARYGHSVSLFTGVGRDALGEYVIERLRGWGVGTDEVIRVDDSLTPVVLAALDPPEDPTIIFYRGAAAPDTRITRTPERDALVRTARIFWMSQGALSQGETARSSREWLEIRGRAQHTILDLDYRPTMWPDIGASREAARHAIAHATIVVGNRDECAMAVEESDPNAAADALLTRGVSIAIVKMGGGGVLVATESERVRISPLPISVVCGLGAGDAFGGALIHGLLKGWDLREVGEFANAAGAYVATHLTCADAMPTSEQVAELRAQAGVA